jgi:hypothetical protein
MLQRTPFLFRDKDYFVDIIVPQYYFCPNVETQINVEDIGFFSIKRYFKKE